MGTLTRTLREYKLWIAAFIACLVCLIVGILIGHFSRKVPPSSLDNFTRDADATISEKLLDEIDPEKILDYLRVLASEPHLAGSKRQNELADWVLREWKDNGADHVEKTPYDVLLSYPDKDNPNKVSLVDQSGNTLFQTAGFEKKLTADQNHSEVVPPFNAYAPAGVVEGQLVYVNYARDEDFKRLTALGINCTGKIAIARYGKIFRGNKLLEAQKSGALGLILYSDPADYAVDRDVEKFPKTWWLPSSGIQRGSTSIDDGDQLTPGYPAKDYAYRMSIPEWKRTIQPQIPCQPISAEEAERFLRPMGERRAPDDWQGHLNIDYNLGPGFGGAASTNKVKLEVNNREEIRTIYNVIGRIDGALEPDRYVIIGSHRDAWMFGSVDPVSSQASLMEIVRVFGKLRKEGWRPRRTLLFASWDGEEYGMIGSYEWVEEHWKTLQDRAVAYLNGDVAIQGNYTLLTKASPIMQEAFRKATMKVMDPDEPSKTLYDTWRHKRPEEANDNNSKPKIGIPGSGTDYAPFYLFAGIPVTYHKYDYDPKLGISSYPLYHSVYETIRLIEIMDPKGKYMATIASVWAELARDLLDSYILPFSVTDSVAVIRQYVKKAKTLYGDRFSSKGLNFDGLESALSNLTSAADDFQRKIDNVDKNNPMAVRQVNDKLAKLEQTFLDPNGQPQRPAMKHVIYSPSSKDNYAGSVFSGIGDLLYDIDTVDDPDLRWQEVKQHYAVIIHVIQAAADFLIQP